MLGVAVAAVALKVEERWSGDLEMAGEAMADRWCDLPLVILGFSVCRLLVLDPD